MIRNQRGRENGYCDFLNKQIAVRLEFSPAQAAKRILDSQVTVSDDASSWTLRVHRYCYPGVLTGLHVTASDCCIVTRKRIGLVGCTSRKLNHAAAARELYSASPIFRDRREYVAESSESWFILSVVAPDTVLEPYDTTLARETTVAKRKWARVVLHELEGRLGDLGGYEFEIHAGVDYGNFGLVQGLRDRGATVTVPAEGIGLFDLPAFYSHQPTKTRKEARQGKRRVGSYEPLRLYLAGRDDDRVEVSFDALERILGRKLPASARNHRAWWSNATQGHSHARGWLDAGWEVDEVNLTAERVAFRKVR